MGAKHKDESETATEKLWAKVPLSVRREVEEIAAREDRTVSYVVRRIVEDALRKPQSRRAA